MKKNKLVILTAALVMSHSAFAQSTTTATLPATGAATTNASTATINAAAAADSVQPSIKYTGFFFGPALNLDGAHQADTNNNDSLSMQHRFQFLIKTNANNAFGIEPRFSTYFGHDNRFSTNVQNENYRLLAKFANEITQSTHDH